MPSSATPASGHRHNRRARLDVFGTEARIALVLAALLAPLTHAEALSYVGSLDPPNANGLFVTTFTLPVPSAESIQNWGLSAGTNAVGAVMEAGGFDPYTSLFRGTDVTDACLALKDDGLGPPGNGAQACAGSTPIARLFAAGIDTLSLMPLFHLWFVENHDSGTLGGGSIGLAVSFDDGSCAAVVAILLTPPSGSEASSRTFSWRSTA